MATLLRGTVVAKAVSARLTQACASLTAQAWVALLKHYQIPQRGKHTVVVGRSLVIGKPVSMLMLNEHTTVAVCHSQSEHLPELCRSADILVAEAAERTLQ